jgi:hypothetical protein
LLADLACSSASPGLASAGAPGSFSEMAPSSGQRLSGVGCSFMLFGLLRRESPAAADLGGGARISRSLKWLISEAGGSNGEAIDQFRFQL